jgi:hypothetical protein
MEDFITVDFYLLEYNAVSCIESQPKFHIVLLVLVACFLMVSCLKWRREIPPKRLLIFNGLHSVISQKMILIIAAVRTSNPKTPDLIIFLRTMPMITAK